MSMLQTITLSIALLATVFSTQLLARQRPDKPNILWIIGEDLGPEFSCYGTTQVVTPVIDNLAKQGVRYANAFTVTPVCSTSRSSFMTGMYAMAIGAHHHRSHRRDGYQLPNGVRLISHRLKDLGYFTANIRHVNKKLKGTAKNDWNFNLKQKPWDSDKWSDLKTNQPFFAQVNFPETHRGRAWDNAHKSIKKAADPKKVVIPPYYPDHPVTRKTWAQYLNTVMSLDKKVGIVLNQLKRDGLDDNTIVFFFGDHGRAMPRGKQWPYDSGLHVPLVIRWAKNFPKPKNFKPGSVDNRLIASIDWTATTLDIAGGRKPKQMQGRIFLGPNAERQRIYLFAGRDRGDETVDRIRTVRTKKYRYIRNYYPDRPFLQLNRYKEASYPILRLMRKLHAEGKLTGPPAKLLASTRPAEELYDITTDPWEINNLATSQKPEHKEALIHLRDTLNRWVERIKDTGAQLEHPDIPKQWDRLMQRLYDKKITNFYKELGIKYPFENSPH